MTEIGAATQTLNDNLDPARARALQATLGLEATINSGDVLPPFFHQIYFWDPQPPGALGRDGHPRLGGFVPDMGLPRRMWAAGNLAFHQPLCAGIQAERRSVIEGVTRKNGRTGPLAFVRLRHDIRQRHRLALSEWQDLVYREDPAPGAVQPEPVAAPTDETFVLDWVYDSTALFRYSALTFNGHKIHYDRDYARDVEGHRGLVVHGPLHAQMLMLLAAAQLNRPLKSFSYRASAPLFEGEQGTYCWRDGTMWLRGSDGRLCMRAEAR